MPDTAPIFQIPKILDTEFYFTSTRARLSKMFTMLRGVKQKMSSGWFRNALVYCGGSCIWLFVICVFSYSVEVDETPVDETFIKVNITKGAGEQTIFFILIYFTSPASYD